MAKYESPFSVGRRQTIFIGSNDPRNKSKKDLEKYRSRAGADVIVKNMPEPIVQEKPIYFIAMEYNNNNTIKNYLSKSTDGITWTKVTAPQGAYVGATWNSITYGVDKFVAVGPYITRLPYNQNLINAQIATSTNGTTWLLGSFGENKNWAKVTYSNGLFVTISDLESAVSTDGISWSIYSLPTITNNTWGASLISGNGLFFATSYPDSGYASYIAKSINGITWTICTYPPTYQPFGVTFGNNEFLFFTTPIVGNQPLVTTNGVTWSTGNFPNTYSYVVDWIDTAYGNGKFVAIGYYSNGSLGQVCAISTNGIAWTKTTLPVSYNNGNIIYENGKFLAQINQNSTSSFSALSTDGITWTFTSNPSYINYNDIAYGDGKFLGISETHKYLTTNGIAWTISSAPYQDSWGSLDWWTKSGAYGSKKFVFIPYNKSFAYSTTNGTSWYRSDLPSHGDTQLIYGGDKFIAPLGYGNELIKSYDGLSWSIGTFPETAYWYPLAYGDGKFITIENYSSNKIGISTDTITWTLRTIPPLSSSYNDRWMAIMYGNGIYLAVAKYGRAISSTDGITWTTSTINLDNTWWDLSYGNGIFVAIALDAAQSAVSTDGITWTIHTMFDPAEVNDTGFWAITYAKRKFVVVSSDSLPISASSVDGINWSLHNLKIDKSNVIAGRT